MEVFLEKSMQPEIFWTAVGAIGTFLAILAAIALPFVISWRKMNQIELVIRKEIDRNTLVINKIPKAQNVTLPGAGTVSPLQQVNALVPHIQLRMWHQYRYELAAERPDSFYKFDSVNCFAEEIVDAPSNPPPMRFMIQQNAAASFLDHYHKAFA